MNKLIKKNYIDKVKLLNEKRFKIISTIIKRDKYKFLKLYTLLIDIQFYLDKFDITYWAIKGTLLGIIRNNGIISWDDNINLCVLYDDFCFINWITEKEKYFDLQIKTFGPVNLYIPSNYKKYLKNHYRNINFAIITQSNSSKLLQNYINIIVLLLHYY